MDDNSIKEIADMLSVYSFKIDAIIDVLIQKGIVSKDEINSALNQVMDKAQEAENNDDYVIEELKKKICIK